MQVSIAEKVFKVIGLKVEVIQQCPWKSCELNKSWTAEGIWTKTGTNTYCSWEMSW